MNEKAHWDRIGAGYDDEIFDVFRSDRNKVLRKYFEKYGNTNHRAIDFGCGTGKAFPYLSPAFKSVTGYDISAELLKVAKTRPFKNIKLKQADLTLKTLHFEPADFLFCCNVIMLPVGAMNRGMFANVHKALRKGGSAVIVVPSMESILYTSFRLRQWYTSEGVKAEKIPDTEFDYYSASKRRVVEGIIHIDGVPTKHYTEPELQVLLTDAKLTVTAIERVEYEWTSEFPEPPKWMKAPYPWDWLIACTKD
jgi:SAM-dependent methyltransferase